MSAATKIPEEEWDTIISMLVVGIPYKTIAKGCGVHLSTIDRLVVRPEFAARYKRAKAATIDAARGKLRELIDLAISTVERVLKSDDARDGDLLRAAELVLHRAGVEPEKLDEQSVAESPALSEMAAHARKWLAENAPQ